ncbi:MAG: hypothetical protein HUU02_10995 [Bacteroidetes bacterium]|nr:hypothetical protein [Bacteroidota bacterium]
MKNNIIAIVLLLLSAGGTVSAGDGGRAAARAFLLQDSTESRTLFGIVPEGTFAGRKGTAALSSLFIPGSGQTLLGSPYKGVTFTVLAFGTALTAVISHNNFVASNERLDALEFQYTTSTTWVVSSSLYSSMNDVYEKLNRYKRTRNTFAVIAAVVWTANIADVMFNTNDEGETVFSSVTVEHHPLLLADGTVDHQQRILVSIPLP